ncbi:MAG TPA: DNA gyrase inhibitor YacG [Afifellaceae bacterium]|nr:DNA gyrase inhibitor YacG [Afifellaceae bacterium]
MSDETENRPQASGGKATPGDSEGASGAQEKLVHLRPPRPCPSCGSPSSRKTFPFCSKRCADVDLNRWLTGKFVIPGRALDDADADEDVPGSARTSEKTGRSGEHD